jgi:hypothetical protein
MVGALREATRDEGSPSLLFESSSPEKMQSWHIAASVFLSQERKKVERKCSDLRDSLG